MAQTTPEENKRLARRFLEGEGTEGNLDLIDELCAEDVRKHSPFGERRGRTEFREESASIHAAFPDVSVTIEDAVSEDDTVAQRTTLRGTHEGEFVGVEPTGNEIEIPYMVFTRFEDGQIAERWLQPDLFGLMQQLGVVEPPTE